METDVLHMALIGVGDARLMLHSFETFEYKS